MERDLVTKYEINHQELELSNHRFEIVAASIFLGKRSEILLIEKWSQILSSKKIV